MDNLALLILIWWSLPHVIGGLIDRGDPNATSSNGGTAGSNIFDSQSTNTPIATAFSLWPTSQISPITNSQMSTSTNPPSIEDENAADEPEAAKSSIQPDHLDHVLSAIEALAGVASVAVAIVVYKLTMRNRALNAGVEVDVEMNDLSTGADDQTHANAVRPDPSVESVSTCSVPYVTQPQNQ